MSEHTPILGNSQEDLRFESTNMERTRANRRDLYKSFLQKHNLTWKLLVSVLIACFGAIQFGYHMGELNAPQKYITCNYSLNDKPFSKGGSSKLVHESEKGLKTCVKLSDQQYGMITSIFSIGGLVGSFYAGNLADKFGRKKMSIFNAFLSLIGSIVLSLSNSYTQFIVGRLIVGVAAGSSIVVVPLTINEMVPVSLRGVFGSMNQGSINVGILFTQFLSLSWANHKVWRYLFVAGAAIALVQLVLLFTLFLETPKWLYYKGQIKEAEKVLHQLRPGTRADVKLEMEEWNTVTNNNNSTNATGSTDNNTNASENSNSRSIARRNLRNSAKGINLWTYVTSSKYLKSRLLITMILVGQQFTGINSIILYGVKVIGNLFENPRVPIEVNIGISILNVLVTFGASPLIDKLGRKPLLISSAILMGIFSYLISFSLSLEYGKMLVAMTFSYIGVFALGVGPIPFLVIPELTSTEALGPAQSYGTVCNWIGTFIVAYGFPVISNVVGISTVFSFFATFSLGFAAYLYFNMPETKGKSNYNEVWGIIERDIV